MGVLPTNLAEDCQPELEVLFDGSIDFELVKQLIVGSVHKETIDPELKSGQGC